MRIVLLALVSLGFCSGVAVAQPVSGFYISGGSGINLPQQQSSGLASTASGSSTAPASAAANAAINGRTSLSQSGSAGWGFGNGLRLELQGMHAAESDASPNGP